MTTGTHRAGSDPPSRRRLHRQPLGTIFDFLFIKIDEAVERSS
jgi:hypothetical protein